METGRLSDNLHSSGTRRHLRVSPTMIASFLIGPVLSAGLKLCW